MTPLQRLDGRRHAQAYWVGRRPTYIPSRPRFNFCVAMTVVRAALAHAPRNRGADHRPTGLKTPCAPSAGGRLADHI
jgi:hypothetical protein